MSEHDKFTQRAKSLLDESVDNLDENSLRRLHIARQNSLKHAREKRSWVKLYWKPMTAGLVAASLIAVISINVIMQSPELEQNYFEDLELVAASEDLDFFQELDFYDWLTEQSDAS